ncbi:MAG: nucleotidyltransferase domain-containing protein [Oligoflexia bacterium]|nr:nucleotidyltransferase domain-containing protein [Oligoflexia bacterium]
MISLLDGKAIEVYIFGSFISNDFHSDSDLDLIIITETKTEFFKIL